MPLPDIMQHMTLVKLLRTDTRFYTLDLWSQTHWT